MRKMETAALLITLALLVASCGFGGVVIGDIVTGPTITDEISVPAPTGGDTPLVVISMGGGELNLGAGDTANLVEGTVAYNVQEIKPTIQIQSSQVRIEQGDIEGKRIPIGNWNDVVNRWDLALGTTPLALTVNAGAARATLSGLAGLSASEIDFNGGAGEFTLDFSGSLQNDMRVSIDAGAAKIAIVVPEGTAAELQLESALTGITPAGDWQKEGSRYVHAGSGPKITFVVKMGVGKLELRNR
jgi:hypothetical protein